MVLLPWTMFADAGDPTPIMQHDYAGRVAQPLR
jgi:hypothetical protein